MFANINLAFKRRGKNTAATKDKSVALAPPTLANPQPLAAWPFQITHPSPSRPPMMQL